MNNIWGEGGGGGYWVMVDIFSGQMLEILNQKTGQGLSSSIVWHELSDNVYS